MKYYRAFAGERTRIWKARRANATRRRLACPEMGPEREGYNVTGLPPAWPDASVLREELAKIWAQFRRIRANDGSAMGRLGKICTAGGTP